MQAKRQRSGGVTVAAVIVLTASVLMVVLGAASLLGFSFPEIVSNQGMVRANPADVARAVRIGVMFYFAVAALCATVGVGLLQLKAWARACVLVLSGVFLVHSLFTVTALLLLGRVVPPETNGVAFSTVRDVLFALIACGAAAAAWCLAFFNLKSVREQFDEYPVTGENSHPDEARTLFLEPHPPLSIVLIGSMYLVSAVSLLPILLHGYPMVLLGEIVRGPVARLAYLLYVPVTLYVGVGLLKLKPPARVVALVLSIVHMLNGALFVLRPGMGDRLDDLLSTVGVTIPPLMMERVVMPVLWIGLVVGTGFSLVIIWILVTRKPAFMPRAAAAA